ncbi:hypothetical protein [Streptomyces sp. 3213.3]|nr:hypothetical protein [Streptomyces sp. 3213.3]
MVVVVLEIFDESHHLIDESDAVRHRVRANRPVGPVAARRDV